jgi:hypothetical protein
LLTRSRRRKIGVGVPDVASFDRPLRLPNPPGVMPPYGPIGSEPPVLIERSSTRVGGLTKGRRGPPRRMMQTRDSPKLARRPSVKEGGTHHKERTRAPRAFVARDYDETLRALAHPELARSNSFARPIEIREFVGDTNSNSEAPARPVRSVPGLRVAAEPGWAMGSAVMAGASSLEARPHIQRSRSPFPFTARAILASSCSTAPAPTPVGRGGLMHQKSKPRYRRLRDGARLRNHRK